MYKRQDQYAVQNWIISVQGQMISGVTECFAGNYESIMEGTYTRDLFAGTDVELLMEAPVSYTHLDVYKRQMLHLRTVICRWTEKMW